MENEAPEKNDVEEITPVDGVLLTKWLKALQHNQAEQIKLLGSIKNMLQFFVLMFILGIVLTTCNAFLS